MSSILSWTQFLLLILSGEENVNFHPLIEEESRKLAVKQYEGYNRGLALTELSFAPIGCRHRSLSSDWSRPGGALSCYNRGVLASLKDVGRNVYTWDPPGLRKCALKETCLARPAEWRHPCHAFLLVGQEL